MSAISAVCSATWSRGRSNLRRNYQSNRVWARRSAAKFISLPANLIATIRFSLGIAAVEQTLMTALIAAQPSNYTAALARQASPATPRHVMRAEELIRTHPERSITVGDLSEVSGVSARALFEGFRRFRSTTPMALLRTVRLERVHADLQAARPSENIAAIAFKWGIVHLGRFAQDYRGRFGERPSETLRKSRGRKSTVTLKS